MKLNHLILVICTGILVGFSACKKDPFTEADAIAAQKELITMKYGYELQLKNIEAAIQKAHDDAAIAMTNLNIKGASDLSKQQLAEDIARNLAYLAAQRDDYTKQRILQDSIDRVFAARNAAEAAAAAYYNMGFDLNGNWTALDVTTEKVVPGTTIKIMKWDASGYYSATANSEGVVVIKQWHVMPTSFVRVSGPAATSKAVYADYTAVAGMFTCCNYFSEEIFYMGGLPMYGYDPSTTAKLSGTIYAASDLTNASSDKAGSGILVQAKNSFGLGGPFKNDTLLTLNFQTATVGGKYSLALPTQIADLQEEDWAVEVAADKGNTIDVYQRAYTLSAGTNPYQTLPTRKDSGLVTLKAGHQSWAAGSAYFMSLPTAIAKSDSKKKYTMTLTDPLGIVLDELGAVGDTRTAGGLSTVGKAGVNSDFDYDVDDFVLNNGWMQTSPSSDSSYYYNLPKGGLTKDSSIADKNNRNPDSTQYASANGKYFSLNEWLALSLAQRTAIIANRVANGVTTYTPSTSDTQLYGPDTLAVEFVDLTGYFMEDAPEFSAIVYNSTEGRHGGIKSKGALQEILLLEDANAGLFDLAAVLDGETIIEDLFTNTDSNYEDAEENAKLNVYFNSATTRDFYFGKRKSGFAISVVEDPYDPSENCKRP